MGLVAVWAEVIPNLDSFGIEKIIRITLSEHSFSINGVHLVYMLIHYVDHFTYEESQDTLLKDRQRRLVSIQPMRVQIAGLPCAVIISLSE